MRAIDRRRFLQLSGGTAAASVLLASIDRAAAIPAYRRTGTIRDVEHIVVLMQENRSFDHYFGTLRGVRGFGDPRPVTLPSGKTVWHQPDGGGERAAVPPRRATTSACSSSRTSPTAGTTRTRRWNSGSYDQWIPAKTATTMAYLDARGHPVPLRAGRRLHRLRRLPLLAHRPHRPEPLLHVDRLHRQRRHGRRPGHRQRRGRLRLDDLSASAWSRRAISWKIYQDVGDGLDAAGSLGLDRATPTSATTATTRCCTSTSTSTRSARRARCTRRPAPAPTPRTAQGFFDILRADVAHGTLPQVSWIVAPEAFTEHRNWPANYGAWYIAQVLDALTANPEVWSKTALFVTYDENDGFFDHVVPPTRPASPAHGASTVDVALRALRRQSSDGRAPVRTASGSACR